MAWFFNFKLRQFTRVCNQKRQIYQFLSRSSGVTEAFGGRMRKYDEINKYWQIYREALPIEETPTLIWLSLWTWNASILEVQHLSWLTIWMLFLNLRPVC